MTNNTYFPYVLGLIIAVVVILLLGLAIQSGKFAKPHQEHVVESLIPFESTFHGFRVYYPKNWEVGEQGGAPFFRLKGAGVNVLYSFDTLSEEKTIEDFIPSMKEQVTQYYQSKNIPFTFVSEEPMRMGDLPAYRWTIDYEREGKQITATQAWTIQNKRAHIFTLTTFKDQHDIFLPVFLRMMETFSSLEKKF